MVTKITQVPGEDRDATYFAREAGKLKASVNGSKERVQALTLEAMAHAEAHGDWTSSLLPIMLVVLNTKDAPGVFGSEMGRLYAHYVASYTKLVYNPNGLNGRKLNKLPMANRWAWDKSKVFDVEAATKQKWWTIKLDRSGRDEKDFHDEAVWHDKCNRFVVGIQRLVNDGDISADEWPAYRDHLIGLLEKVKLPEVKAGRIEGSDDGRIAPSDPKRVDDGGDEAPSKAAA